MSQFKNINTSTVGMHMHRGLASQDLIHVSEVNRNEVAFVIVWKLWKCKILLAIANEAEKSEAIEFAANEVEICGTNAGAKHGVNRNQVAFAIGDRV